MNQKERLEMEDLLRVVEVEDNRPVHYQSEIDVYDFVLANGIGMLEGNIVKYVTRKKGDLAKRIDDLQKARLTIDRLISHEKTNLAIERGEIV